VLGATTIVAIDDDLHKPQEPSKILNQYNLLSG
jgi:hypothetical protein